MAVRKEPERVCWYSKNNAAVPLEKDTLTLNRRLKESDAVKSETSSSDYSCAAKSPDKPPSVNTETYLERCIQLERENVEVKNKVKKMENYCRGCKTELQRFVKRFREFKSINKDLDLKNKKLLIKNQQMRQRIAEVLKENRPQFEDLEKVTEGFERQYQERQRQKGMEIKLQPEKKQLTEQVREAQTDPPQISEGIQEGGNQEKEILTQLQQENKTLRETLEHSGRVLKDAELRAERSQKQQDELENCLLAVQTEKSLLRQELKRLHKEYMSLTSSISLQLKQNNKAASLSTEVREEMTQGFQGHPQRDMHYNPPQQRSTQFSTLREETK